MPRCDRCVWVVAGAGGGAVHQCVADATDAAADAAHMEQILLVRAENSLRHAGGMAEVFLLFSFLFLQLVFFIVHFLSGCFSFLFCLLYSSSGSFNFFTIFLFIILSLSGCCL